MSWIPHLLNVLSVVAPIACWTLVTRVPGWIALYCSAAASWITAYFIGMFLQSTTPIEQKRKLASSTVQWLFWTTTGGIIAGTVAVFKDIGFSTGSLWGMGLLAFLGGIMVFTIAIDASIELKPSPSPGKDEDRGHRTLPKPPPPRYAATDTAIFFTNADTAERGEKLERAAMAK
ncbi:hypothetical protein FA95DRAFT_1575676 [Auriscalpium vulgare]|uniref:Uncharacterized protein n=1 Tax=Auriscalpium vulgare TaxID=40419 RepID=A0ACB8RF86_9AGAM|nr:hypothetical protein FA95DRAFT_1575676 [Auriscalpium vulgare]